ncbi:hypothetical protein H5410_064703 [Solanum commersonii]|uniref:Uncharacterized protein n=1 Tax=Solanum commersonii TaxID=4109 RepID=A0A9J5VYR3_SOLCO|nr:hypothetical protein H5410_064703 [Solanum commersonii]
MNLSVSAYFGLYTIKYIKKLIIAIEGSRSEFAEKRSLPLAFENDEYEVREAAGTMDPLTPNRVAFPGLAGVAWFGGPKLTWLRQKASSLKARLARRPSRSRGESHASVCGSRSHTLIPTGARSRPAALPKPIIISVPRPHCWKGSASKPYVELPPHTAPLGMEVGPAQACAVKSREILSRAPKPNSLFDYHQPEATLREPTSDSLFHFRTVLRRWLRSSSSISSLKMR